jgi:hypothetical protein
MSSRNDRNRRGVAKKDISTPSGKHELSNYSHVTRRVSLTRPAAPNIQALKHQKFIFLWMINSALLIESVTR